jgi:two-component system NtrC family sensor kinase
VPDFFRRAGGLVRSHAGRGALIVNKHEQGNSTGGTAGRANFKSSVPLIAVFLLSAAVAAAYEVVKSLLSATITTWPSRELTIGFIALSSTAVFYFARRAQEATARSRMGAERLKAAAGAEKQFRLLFAGNPLPMWLYDRETLQFLEVNEAAVRQYGYSKDEFLGMTIEEIRPAEDVPSVREHLAERRRTLQVAGSRRHRLKDGRVIDVEIRSQPWEWKGRQAVLVVAQDTTERIRAQEGLCHSHQLLQSVLDSIPQRVFWKDRDSNFLGCNQAFAGDAGLKDPAEIVGKNDSDLPSKESAESYRADDRRVMDQDTPRLDFEERMDRSGGNLWLRTNKMPLHDRAGRVIGVLGTYEDITERKQAEESLRQSEEKYRSLVSNIPDVTWTVDSRYHFVYVSKNIEEISGYSVDEIYQKGPRFFLEVLHPDDLARTRAAIEALLTRGEPYDGELRFRRRDGEWVWVHSRAVSAYEKDGIRYVDGLFSDITERKRADEAQAFLASLVESSTDAIVGKTLNGTIVSWNKGAELLYGYRADEVIGKPVSLLAPADRAAEVQQVLERVRAGETTSNFETSRLRKDGTAVEVSLTVSPIRNSAGEITGAASIAHDITERKWNEHELSYERRLFQALMDNIPDTIYFQDTACRFIRINKAQARMLGISDPNEAIGRTDFDFFPADFAQGCYEAEQKLIQSGQPIVGAVQKLTRPNGQVQWLSSTEVPLRDAEDRVFGFVGISRDITERKRDEQQMRLLTTALESAANGVTITDRAGRILWVNPAFTRLTGYSAAEVVGQNPRVLKSGAQDGAFYRGLWDTVLAGAVWHGELVNRRKDGSLYTEEMTITPVRDDTQAVSHFIAIKRDVSERKLAEEKLRLAEEKHRSLVLNIPDVVWTRDSNGRVTFISPKIEKVSGYTVDEIRQQGARLFLDSIHPDDLRKVSEALKSLFEKGREYNVECRFRRKSGEWIWLRDRAVATYERDGVRFADGVLSDITEYKRLGIDLHQAQKLEAVGRLASGIAHEINTPIQFVGDNTRFLQDSFSGLEILIKKYRDLKDWAAAGGVTPARIEEVTRAEKESDSDYLLEEIPKALSQTLDGVNRVATIVRAMKDFAHPDGTEKAAADLNKALLSTLTVARNELKYVADVETEFGDLPPVVCNIGDLNQVFLNLLVNAAHAIADKVKGTGTKGQIRVRTTRENGAALITISDTGCGIPEANRARVFDPFFTTKEVGRGTGQGLAIARSVVVERHKGRLTFESEVGKGTTFYIRLPLVPVEGVKDRSAA